MQAIRAAETGRTDEAERRVGDAERVAVSSPWPLYARGMFARMENHCKAAADLFQEALKADPKHAESTAALSEALARMGELEKAEKLVEGIGRITDWRALLKLGQMLYEAGRWEACQPPLQRAIELMAKEKDGGAEARFRGQKALRFIDPLTGLPLRLLDIDRTSVEDLLPLRGTPLRELHCSATRVSDLDPLKGVPLTSLQCSGTRVRDLSPLEGMRLTRLGCGGTRVKESR